MSGVVWDGGQEWRGQHNSWSICLASSSEQWEPVAELHFSMGDCIREIPVKVSRLLMISYVYTEQLCESLRTVVILLLLDLHRKVGMLFPRQICYLVSCYYRWDSDT